MTDEELRKWAESWMRTITDDQWEALDRLAAGKPQHDESEILEDDLVEYVTFVGNVLTPKGHALLRARDGRTC